MKEYKCTQTHPLVLQPRTSSPWFRTAQSVLHSPGASALGDAGLGLARLALTRAWSTASSRFLESSASVWAAANICRWHSSLSEVTEFCWASRIFMISSPKSLFSSFLVPSIWRGRAEADQTGRHAVARWDFNAQRVPSRESTGVTRGEKRVRLTSVKTELCRDGRISSTLWIRLRRVIPTSWGWGGGRRRHSLVHYGHLLTAFLNQKQTTYLDTVGILGGRPCVDVILQLDHLFHHRHDGRVNLVTWPVQLSGGLRLQRTAQKIWILFSS